MLSAPALAAGPGRPLIAEAPVPAILEPVPTVVLRPAPAPTVTIARATAVDRWIWPVHGPISQPFSLPGHHGLDITADYGSFVLAARPGTVLKVDEDSIYGLYVVIDHGGGLETLYAHLSRALVLEGKPVAAGEILGRVGLTGRTSGPHLHFGVSQDGAWRDPLSYLLGDQ